MDVLILEDHEDAQQWLSDAITIAFGNETAITIVDTVESACSTIDDRDFDLFIVDMHLPDGSGVEALTHAKRKNPSMKAVVATIYSDDGHIFPALKAGANGYLLKDDTKENIATMIAGILDDVPPLSGEIAQRLMSHFDESNLIDERENTPELTKRELESLKYIVKGFSIKECANLMEISPHTVSGYIKDIYKKLAVSSRAEVTTEATRLGLV